MPIYAYKCESCGHVKDVLQRIADEPLSTCPACGAASFRKQVTAAGFQLKGSGWYVTDFRGGNTATAPAVAAETPPAGDSSTSATPASPAAPGASASAPAPAPVPAAPTKSTPTP